MAFKLILFDIDGTLLLSGGAGGRAMKRAGQTLFGDTFQFNVDTAGMLDPHIYAELCAANPRLEMAGEHDTFRETYLTILETMLTQTPGLAYSLPGVEELLRHLQTRVQLGLLTGNYGPAAQLKLRHAGLSADAFGVTAFGDEAPTRPALVPLALSRYEELYGESLRSEEVIVIGDTPKDIDCALQNGSYAFGVATGKYSAAELREAGAQRVVENLREGGGVPELLGIGEGSS